jgi:signal transduction histidine kinase
MHRTLRLAARYILCFCAWYTAVAAASVDVDEVHVIDRAIRSPVADASSTNTQTRPVMLPDVWNAQALQGRWRYTLQIHIDRVPIEAWGIYVPRAGNRFRITLNGRFVAQVGAFGESAVDHAQRPHFFPLPDGLLRSGQNLLEFELEGERGRYAGLSKVHVGPDRLVRRTHAIRHAVQVGGLAVVAGVCVTFGVMALALFAKLRQWGDAFFALACFFCAVRVSYVLVERVPVDFRVWQGFVDLCYAGLVSTVVLFCARTLDMRVRLWTRLTITFSLISLVLVPWHAFAQRSDVRQVWLLLMLVFVTAASIAIIHRWWRVRSAVAALLASAAAAGLAMGAHDHWIVFYTRDGYGSFALARFALVAFIFAMGWIIVDRVVTRVREERAMREAMTVELEQRKRALAIEFEIASRLAAERAKNAERERLVQDLHDGMGLQLNSLLGLVERGQARPDELQSEVRNSIEQLRTLVDGSQTFDGSLAELFGHIRYRVEARLRRQGVVLHWHSDDLPADRTVRPAAAISLQYLVFELCTNVIKHANAQRVKLAVGIARTVPDGNGLLWLSFEDDGNPPPEGNAPLHPGTGMRSLHRRVEDLQGAHDVVRNDRGWRHHMTFPLQNLLEDAASQEDHRIG